MLGAGRSLHLSDRKRGATGTPPPGSGTTIGTGPDSLVLKITQQAYNGSAQYTVSVNGTQIGGTLTAVAVRGSGQQDTVTVQGDWAQGTHTCSVNFLNDDWAGVTAGVDDRNLYLEGATYNGVAVSGSSLDLLSAGAQSFTFTETAAGGGTPPPNPPATTGKVINAIFVGNARSDPSEVIDLNRFEAWLGKNVEGVLAYTGNDTWGDCDPGWQIGGNAYVGSSGREALWSIPNFPRINSLAEMRSAASGAQNSRYRGWAQQIVNARSGDSRDIHVRTCWELGGEWFWWTNDAKADRTAFINAFRNFADSFHAISPRFKIAWDIVPDRTDQFGLVEDYYPGDAYVDVIAQDVYWHTQWDGDDPNTGWQRKLNDFGNDKWRGLDWCENFARTHGKGLAIPEWGVPGASGDTHNTARYMELMRNWCTAKRVSYMTYWNSPAGGYDGLLSDGDPSGSATALRNHFYTTLNWT